MDNPDLRIMVLMSAILNLLFVGLLTLSSLHSGTIRGMRHWALASLLNGLVFGLGLAITQKTGFYWVSLIMPIAFISVVFLQLKGIKAFKEEDSSWLIPWLFWGFIVIGNILLVIFYPHIKIRIIFNSLCYSIVNFMCARALLIRIASPLCTAYWFTGCMFIVQSAFGFFRGVRFIFSTVNEQEVFIDFHINSFILVLTTCSQLCLFFGFILMLNYRLASDLKALASTDGLTGALNRRSLEHEAGIFESLFTRTGDSLTVILLDIDHFKLLNDNYGHAMGDTVLKQLPTVAKAIIREYDCFARYGGEEFCILLPSTTESEALLIAERLRLAYAATFQAIDHHQIHSTISIGVADSAQVGLTFAALSKAADQAMYRAKQGGRNRVIGYSALGNQNRGQPVNFDS